MDSQICGIARWVDFERNLLSNHLAFGRGPHYCIGAHLARIQLQEAISILVRDIPGLALAVPADEVPWQPSMVTHAPACLPITW